MRPEKLTEHFSLRELEQSPTAKSLNIDNRIPDELLPNVKRLAEFLELVRHAVGDRTVRINSGYRSVRLNKAVRGAAASSHLRGLAADIVVPGMVPKAVCEAIVAAGLAFDKVIEEGTWTHVAIPEENQAPRRITMTARFDAEGRPTYTEGLNR